MMWAVAANEDRRWVIDNIRVVNNVASGFNVSYMMQSANDVVLAHNLGVNDTAGVLNLVAGDNPTPQDASTGIRMYNNIITTWGAPARGLEGQTTDPALRSPT